MTARDTMRDELVAKLRVSPQRAEQMVEKTYTTAAQTYRQIRTGVLVEAVALIEAARAADEAMYRDEPAQINRRVGMREAMALLRRMADEPTAGPAGKDTRAGESTRIVAYRSNGGRLLRCLVHSRDIAGDDFVPVTSEDLPDGGICTYPDCGTDVLIPVPPAPRTERSYWVAIAEALNAAATVGMPVGIEMDGTLTDYRAWSVIWNRAEERWDVGGYDDDGLPDGPGTAPDFFQPGHTYTRRDDTGFQCFAVTTNPTGGGPLAIGWHTDVAGSTYLAHCNLGEWLHEYDGGKPPADSPESKAAATAGGGQ